MRPQIFLITFLIIILTFAEINSIVNAGIYSTTEDDASRLEEDGFQMASPMQLVPLGATQSITYPVLNPNDRGVGGSNKAGNPYTPCRPVVNGVCLYKS